MAVAAARRRLAGPRDAHATVPPDYVERALDHLVTGDGAASGVARTASGEPPAGRAIAAAMASRFGVGGSTYHYGTEAADGRAHPVRRLPGRVIRELGGWDERLRVNQDFEFDFRVRESGRELLFDPQLRIGWESRQSVPDLFSAVQAVRPRQGEGRRTAPHLCGAGTWPHRRWWLRWPAAAVTAPRHPVRAGRPRGALRGRGDRRELTTAREVTPDARRGWPRPSSPCTSAGGSVSGEGSQISSACSGVSTGPDHADEGSKRASHGRKASMRARREVQPAGLQSKGRQGVAGKDPDAGHGIATRLLVLLR